MKKPLPRPAAAGLADWQPSATQDWRQVPDLETPFVAVSEARLMCNLQRGAAIAKREGLSLRPHIKTHKSIAIARSQLALGASGLTASKPREALVFIKTGFPSITIAYPVVAAGAARTVLREAQEAGCDLRMIVDSVAGVEALEEAATRPLPVFLKVDVGLGRCGVRPTTAAFDAVLKALLKAPNLKMTGLLSHAGHSYAAGGPDGIRGVAEQEIDVLEHARDRVVQAGGSVDEISVGSTPTVLASTDFGHATELRPGNYAFLDLTALRLGIAGWQDLALAVVATVISENDGFSIIDAGSKTLSSDGAPHGGTAAGFGLALPVSGSDDRPPLTVARLSEEHGFVDHGGQRLGIGSRLAIFPNHACPVANLATTLTMVSTDGTYEPVSVDAHATSSS